MKRLIIFILLGMMFASVNNFAQSNVDLNKMVKNQIENAQAKAKKDQLKKDRMAEYKAAQEGYSSGIISIYTFVTFSLLIVGGVAARRLWLKQQNTKKRIVKQGILMMRQERIITLDNPKKSFIRHKLGTSHYSAHAKGSDITRLARLLEVSQGEVLLAKKINARQYAPYRSTFTDAVEKKSSDLSRYTNEKNDAFGKHLKEYLMKKQNIDTEKLIYLN